MIEEWRKGARTFRDEKIQEFRQINCYVDFSVSSYSFLNSSQTLVLVWSKHLAVALRSLYSWLWLRLLCSQSYCRMLRVSWMQLQTKRKSASRHRDKHTTVEKCVCNKCRLPWLCHSIGHADPLMKILESKILDTWREHQRQTNITQTCKNTDAQIWAKLMRIAEKRGVSWVTRSDGFNINLWTD